MQDEVPPNPIVEEEIEPQQESDQQARLSELESELEEANNAMLRAMADLQNYRRRSLQEAQIARETAIASMAARLLPALDNFERALDAAESGASAESIIEGVRLMDKQLRSALDEFHIKPINAVGEQFDPHLHEAVVIEESEAPEGTIIQEIEKGYALGKRVIRPTKARVSKGQSG